MSQQPSETVKKPFDAISEALDATSKTLDAISKTLDAISKALDATSKALDATSKMVDQILYMIGNQSLTSKIDANSTIPKRLTNNLIKLPKSSKTSEVFWQPLSVGPARLSGGWSG